MQEPHPSTHDERVPAMPSDDHQTSHTANSTTGNTSHSYNHSNQKLEEIQKMTDLDKFRINKENYLYQYEYDRRRTTGRCELHKKEDIYGNESINRKRVESDVYGDARQTADLKFKFVRDGREEPIGRTMGRVRAIAVVGLFFAMLATCAAAPLRTRRHNERNTRNYLETFGYLKKGRPEVGNLLMGDEAQDYEDNFRIAIKTLQEFGGIPVTGEIDEDTIQLMKQKRCGRPDREDDEESGHRRKRFAIDGRRWKHTNLTWSLSQDRMPSQLDPYMTRSVLAHALDIWAQASKFTFKEINSNQADIVVSFARWYHDDAFPFDGRGSILAHAFFPGTGKGGDAHFDDDELWLLQPINDNEEGTSLFAVAAHEFGHSLGLSHSSVKGALMFPWYQGIKQNFVLPQDDRNGIQQMYGPKENNRWAQIPHYNPTRAPPTTTTPTTTTSTTTRWTIPRYHNDKYPSYRPVYTPSNPREPSRNRTYYPQKPYYPYPPNYPEYPNRHNPQGHYPTVDHSGRTNKHPRPTTTSTTTSTTTPAPTYRPRVPTTRPDIYPAEPKRPKNPKKTTHRPNPARPYDMPDECDMNYDAISLIRNELYIFKGKYHWRIGVTGRYKNYPIKITRTWTALPANLTHVDAVYERQDQKIVIFIGKLVYLFKLDKLVYGYPKPISSLGLPEHLEKVDAAMVWGYNSKTYFYSGSMYWKFDEDEGRVEPDYPRNMAMWKGVGYNIDSVFQWRDGKTYFFKGKGFWKFNDLQMRVEHEMQLPSAQFWMACPMVTPGTRSPYRALSPQAPGSTLRSLSHATTLSLNSILLYLSSTILLLRYYFKYV